MLVLYVFLISLLFLTPFPNIWKAKLQDGKTKFLFFQIMRLLEPKGITVEEWNHDGDHVHILFRSVPNIDLSKAINSYKSVSSRYVKRDFPQIRQSLWKEMFWSRSYCLLTTGGAPIETIRQYIASQGMKEPYRDY